MALVAREGRGRRDVLARARICREGEQAVLRYAKDRDLGRLEATMAPRPSLAPPRHCLACGAEIPYLGGRGRPRRWCDAHHPRPLRLARERRTASGGDLTPALADHPPSSRKSGLASGAFG